MTQLTQEEIILDKKHKMLHKFIINTVKNYNGARLYIDRSNLWTSIFNARKASNLPYAEKNNIVFELINAINVAKSTPLTMEDLESA